MERIKITDWDKYYRENELNEMPWYSDLLDHDFDSKIKELKLFTCNVLDLGSGPGTHSIALAKLGFNVTAIDISETAILKASQKAEAEGVAVNFLQDDILNTGLSCQFDLIFDRGCFHVFELEKRDQYVSNIKKLLTPSGFLLLKCFSSKEPGSDGPKRVSPDEIKFHFDEGFKVLSIVDSQFIGNHKPYPKALFCVVQSLG